MNISIDESLVDLSIQNRNMIFLEETWEYSSIYGMVNNTPNLHFYTYLRIMLETKNYEMASDAIKNWENAYKQENIFEILFSFECEELMVDLVETAKLYEFKVEITELQFNRIINKFYFLLKSIVGSPLYSNFFNSDSIQMYLVDPLRLIFKQKRRNYAICC